MSGATDDADCTRPDCAAIVGLREKAASPTYASLRGRTAVLEVLAHLRAHLGGVLVSVDRDRVLHGGFEQLAFAVGGDRHGAIAFARRFAAIDEFACHESLLVWFECRSFFRSRRPHPCLSSPTFDESVLKRGIFETRVRVEFHRICVPTGSPDS